MVFGHKGQLLIALTSGCAGEVAEEFLDPSVVPRVPEGARCKHVEDGVDGAADEDHGSSDEDHGAPNALQRFCHVRKGIFNGQDDERENVPDVMRRPANGEHNHYACDQDGGPGLGLEGNLSDATAQATIAGHKDREGQYVAHQGLQEHNHQLLGGRRVFLVETVFLSRLLPDNLRLDDGYAEQESRNPQSQQNFMESFLPLPSSWGKWIAYRHKALHAQDGDEENAAIHAGIDYVHHGFTEGLPKHPRERQRVDPQRQGDKDQQVSDSQVQDEHHSVGTLLDVSQDGPDHQQIPRSSYQEGQTQDDAGHCCPSINLLRAQVSWRRHCTGEVHAVSVCADSGVCLRRREDTVLYKQVDTSLKDETAQ